MAKPFFERFDDHLTPALADLGIILRVHARFAGRNELTLAPLALLFAGERR